MRKLLAGVVVAVVAGSLVAPASAQSSKKQEVQGTIIAPAPFTDDSGCYAGMHRRGSVVTQGNNNMLIGYEFELNEKTWGKPFMLTVDEGQLSPDLDIYFYQEFGDLMQILGDPTGAPPGATAQYNTREPGGEHEIVPELMKKAIVCIYTGALGQGAAVDFTYVAGKGVKKPK